MKLAQLMKISDLKIKRFNASLALFMIPIMIVFVVFLMQQAGLVSK
jgi:ABC-type maltose transport system permease subunit